MAELEEKLGRLITDVCGDQDLKGSYPNGLASRVEEFGNLAGLTYQF